MPRNQYQIDIASQRAALAQLNGRYEAAKRADNPVAMSLIGSAAERLRADLEVSLKAYAKDKAARTASKAARRADTLPTMAEPIGDDLAAIVGRARVYAVRGAMHASGGNVAQAAKRLGITERSLRSLAKRYAAQ